MKLVLRAPTDNFLQLELEDLAAPVVKKLTLNDSQIQSLQHLCISYQAAINKPNAIGELRTIGDQLFALLNQQSDLIGRWLNHVGKRQLEINTTLAPRPLQRLLLELPWEIMTNGNQFLASDTQLFEVVRRVGKANSAAPQARYKLRAGRGIYPVPNVWGLRSTAGSAARDRPPIPSEGSGRGECYARDGV